MVSHAQRWIVPILGSERAARRNNRVFPERSLRNRAADLLAEDEIVTTATANREEPATAERPTSETSTSVQRNGSQPSSPTTTGVVRQWVSELAGAARPANGGGGTVRVPGNDELQTLTAMFPDVSREVILGVLQRRYAFRFFYSTLHRLNGYHNSENIEMAAETLLSSAH